MREIIQNVLSLVLVVATMQSGMAQWTPHFGADAISSEGKSSSQSSPLHEDHAHSGASDTSSDTSNVQAPPGEAQGRRCDQPNIGCDCPNCLGYFDAHSHALPTIHIVLPEAPQAGTHENSTIMSLTSVNHTPPAPPPRLLHPVPRPI